MRDRMMKLGIIGGTGVYDMPVVDTVEEQSVDTAYGAVRLRKGIFRNPSGEQLCVVFVPRHGAAHSVPPHRINYRANIKALCTLGVTDVVGTTAVGSLREDIAPGQLVLLDQFIDFTRTRNYTFFDGGPEGVRHTDMTYPYDESLRQLLQSAASEQNIDLRPRGIYVCTEGPRFETAAEIRMFAQLGADVVGMTNVPEVILANEARLNYAAVSLVTNYGAGISDSPLTHDEVTAAMDANMRKLTALLTGFFDKKIVSDDGGGTGE